MVEVCNSYTNDSSRWFVYIRARVKYFDICLGMRLQGSKREQALTCYQ